MRGWLIMLIVWALAGGMPAHADPTRLTFNLPEEDAPPFEFRRDGRNLGLHIEMVEAAAHRLGIAVRWNHLPWRRALREVEWGQADGSTYVSRTPRREEWAHFLEGNLLSTTSVVVVAMRDRKPSLGEAPDWLTWLQSHKPLIQRGFQFGLPALDRLPHMEASTLPELYRMLREGFAETAVINWEDWVGAYAGKPEFTTVEVLGPPLVTSKNYLIFSKRRHSAAFAQRFAEALEAYRHSEAYQQLLRRHALLQ